MMSSPFVQRLFPVRNGPASIQLHFSPVRRPTSPVGWLLLLAGLAVAVVEAVAFFETQADLAERAFIVDALRAERAAAAPAAPARPPLAADELRAAGRVFSRLDTDWSGVFAALARVRDNDVAWVEVELLAAGEGETSQGGMLRLTGQARTLDAVLGVSDRIRKDPAFVEPQLVSHEVVTGQAGGGVRFTLTTRWGPHG